MQGENFSEEIRLIEEVAQMLAEKHARIFDMQFAMEVEQIRAHIDHAHRGLKKIQA